MRPFDRKSRPSRFLDIASRPAVVRRGIAFAAIVGPILISINHWDAILAGDVTIGRLVKMGLTVTVPYMVSTFSSVGAIRNTERGRSEN